MFYPMKFFDIHFLWFSSALQDSLLYHDLAYKILMYIKR
uniref:Uncharacterized protein n=1 Tax=Arundo donax TaxID=35708 RepID=A0A0A9G2S6_ARUDO